MFSAIVASERFYSNEPLWLSAVLCDILTPSLIDTIDPAFFRDQVKHHQQQQQSSQQHSLLHTPPPSSSFIGAATAASSNCILFQFNAPFEMTLLLCRNLIRAVLANPTSRCEQFLRSILQISDIKTLVESFYSYCPLLYFS